MRTALIAGLLALAPLYAETIVIRNANIMTVTHGNLKGSIVVKDGKIAEVGEKVLEPAGATIIDAGGHPPRGGCRLGRAIDRRSRGSAPG